MTRMQARKQAKMLSKRYNTFWFVKQVSPGVFEPWAYAYIGADHSEFDSVHYYCGQRRLDEEEQNVSTLSRQHFEAITSLIKQASEITPATRQLEWLSWQLAAYFRSNNAEFNRGKFLQACGQKFEN
jgi:hypothetical protein